MRVTTGYLEGSAVVLLGRENGRRTFRQVPAEYVAYFDANELDPVLERHLRTSIYVRSLKRESGGWLRVGFVNEPARSDFCNHRNSPVKQMGIHTYEADVDPVLRHVIDNNVEIAKPRRVYLDLESDSRVPFSKKEEMRILAWALVDDEGNSQIGVLQEDTERSEKKLLDDLWLALEPYDQVVAWNGDNFDFPLLFARSRARGCTVNASKWLWLDHLVLFRRMNQNAAESGEEKQSMKLNDIAQAVVGEGKEITPPEVIAKFGDKSLGALAWALWEAGGEWRQILARYNLKDTILLQRIEAETGYIALFDTLCEACHIFPDSRSINPTHQMDGFMLHLGLARSHHFPTKHYRHGTEQFLGAYVMEPQGKGILRGVHVCDFASLYPSIILTWNMSPETKAPVPASGELPPNMCRSPLTGIGFTTDQEGILPVALKELLRLRKHWNDLKASCAPGTPEWHEANRKSTAFKTAANSFYGIVGSPFSRFFDPRIAESVTQNGKWLLQATLAAAEERGMHAIYGDTDSGFVANVDEEQFRAFTKWCNAELYPKILAEQGCVENHIKLEYEKAFERIVFVTAKRYCNPPEAPVWMADGRFKKLGDIQIGDRVAGWVRGKLGTKIERRRLEAAEVVAVTRRRSPIVKVTLASGRTFRCTPDHRWLSAGGRMKSEYVTSKVGRSLVHVIDEPHGLSFEGKIEAAWLGGIWDGEGSIASEPRTQLVITQSKNHNPEVCQRIERAFRFLGLKFGTWCSDGKCNTYALHGSKQQRLNFVTWCNPAKGERIRESLLRGRLFGEKDEIVLIEPDGEGEVIGLTTTTGNYIVWGYASKNCGKYLHFKGKRATAESKPEIKGLEYKRGDALLLARRLQSEVIDLLCGGLNIVKDISTPTDELEHFHNALSRMRSYVLEHPLPLEEVKIAKALSKELKEYTTKVKKDGKASAQPPHVQIGKVLSQRGEEVGEGTRVEYIVIDGAAKPMKVAPASDYTGSEADRYYLWENLIYPPSQRLLESAFPEHDWAKWLNVRPPKPKSPRSKKPRVE